MLTEPQQRDRQDVGACSVGDIILVLGSPVHGPRQDGSGTLGQVLSGEMQGVLSSDEATKSP